MDPVLAPWGFGEQEEAAYRAILRRPGVTMDELAAELGLPREQVRRDARKLIRNRLVRRRGAGVVGLRPDLALAGLVERAESQLAADRENLARTEATITQFLHDHVLGERDRGSPPGIELVTGKAALRAAVGDLVREHTGEILALVRPPVGDMPAPALVVQAVAESGRRLQARTVHSHDSLKDGGGTLAERLREAGAAVRVVGQVPTKLLIFRGRAALVKADPARPDHDELLVVRAPALLAALAVIFERLWDRATPIDRLDDGGGAPDRRMLELLASGVQDEAIAEQLGVSVRTVRRRVAELLEELGARTRFQAGAQAARRGLL